LPAQSSGCQRTASTNGISRPAPSVCRLLQRNLPQAVSSATLIPALKALLNRIEISFDHCIENRRTTKSGEWNWVNQFRSPGVLAAIVQHYRAQRTARPLRRELAGFAILPRSPDPQILRRSLPLVGHFLIAHLGTLIEGAQAGSFHRRDMYKHVFAAVIGLDKSKSLSPR
jgi:hypothetical protein